MLRLSMVSVALLVSGTAFARGGGHCHGHSGSHVGSGGKKLNPESPTAETIHAETIHAPGPTDRVAPPAEHGSAVAPGQSELTGEGSR